MRVGVVSDTHNNLKNVRTIVELFNAEQVDRVIHTGDISQAKTLDVLAGLHAPLFGVFGNNDQEREVLQDAIQVETRVCLATVIPSLAVDTDLARASRRATCQRYTGISGRAPLGRKHATECIPALITRSRIVNIRRSLLSPSTTPNVLAWGRAAL